MKRRNTGHVNGRELDRLLDSTGEFDDVRSSAIGTKFLRSLKLNSLDDHLNTSRTLCVSDRLNDRLCRRDATECQCAQDRQRVLVSFELFQNRLLSSVL